ncbi:RTA1 like protein-domain-containing protein [Bisporella sp. PMI_857]|nr:RTA1 like protein-domain-containing protein [Bisporella sp. PMI_857]
MAGRPPSKYQYYPSLAAAIIFTVLFGLSGVLHCIQLLRTKTWYFVPFFIGVIFEVVGFGARSVNATQSPNWSQAPFIIQTLLPLIAPALFAASIYMILGRIIRFVDAEHLSFIRTTWLTKIFVFGDVASFLVQCLGGGILAAADSKSALDRGQSIILVGLAIQIIFFGCFIIAISLFHYRIIQQPTVTSLQTPLPWKQYVLVLYFSSLLILVRSIFRVAEFAAGHDSALQTSEAYLYCFDAVLMVLCCVVFNLRHPSRVVSSRYRKDFTNVELHSAQTPTEQEAIIHRV